MDAISLFSGAGGLDIGCEMAGFSTRAAVECNEMARKTLLDNADHFLPGLRQDAVFNDIDDLDYDALLGAAGLKRSEADLVHGGPPCTPFSKSGYWLAYKRAGADPKASLLDNYIEALKAIRPKAFMMENVFALAYRNQNRPVLERFIAGARNAGYSFDMKVMIAADYGVPQLRQRLICVGVREDLIPGPVEEYEFPFPQPTHSGPHETRTDYDLGLKPHVTTREALKGLPSKRNPPEPEEHVTGTFEEEFRKIPPGDNYLFWTERRGHPEPRFEWRKRYWTFLLKLHPDRPSPTIQGQPGPWVGPFHWRNRRLRVAEVKRLMTFPDDYVICGSRREQQLQLGNAVPPLLARVVTRSIRTELQRLCPSETVALAA